ncbi:hypothetical protein [Candidatus Erwinia dacicola]|uniref:Putative transposase n=1 Tax=Candidatus Erwinia dacicola TaxID=252393 RepID=A0A1E7YWA2_9GAMM|nr:hypothetical protein [Candidatus Erwinia dacicola]NJD00721.1 hypothetical protein [Candidatus Erwinia dacicola]OFC60781.1 hypothetical protein BBW68_14265 [Candidatus Erwinia dacicola]RAP70932.1 putative transposase [Candidatus Erwinia dacicola]
MSIAKRLKEEGRAQGIGIKKGKLEARIEITSTLLASGLEQATVMNTTGLTAGELAQIRH